MKLLQQLNSTIARIEGWLLVATVLFMVVLSFLQVVLRNLFSEGIMGADILLRHLVLWVGFIGASLATRDEKHINIDLFTRFLSGRKKMIANIIIYLFSIIVGYYLTTAAWTFVMMEREFETVLFGSVLAWYFQLIIPLGFALITFRFCILTIEKSVQLFSGNEGSQ